MALKLRLHRIPKESAVLLDAGWWICDEGWRHGTLKWPWPSGHAYRLQMQADSGCMDLVCRMLRGEE